MKEMQGLKIAVMGVGRSQWMEDEIVGYKEDGNGRNGWMENG